MSECSQFLLLRTSKAGRIPAVLVLEDGTVYEGYSCGAQGEAIGEICFNTTMEGYFEVITDPSYAGQVVVMTYPQIGNYGVDVSDAQAETPYLRALVVSDLCETPSNWRSSIRLSEYAQMQHIVVIEGIDTRALVRRIREGGAQRALVATARSAEDGTLIQDLPAREILREKVRNGESLAHVNHVQTVSRENSGCANQIAHGRTFALMPVQTPRHRVVVYDCGVKQAILDELQRSGCELTVVPWNTPAQEVLDLHPDGVFLSNGPGDPDTVEETYAQVEKLLGNVPIFGICLGHQMMAKAAGGVIEKLKFGHHGGNHPVMNLLTGHVEITSQNHGYGLIWESIGVPMQAVDTPENSPVDLRTWVQQKYAPILHNERFGRIQLTHVNLNDGTCEGMRFLDIPALSVQYHPEASPGPSDSRYLFEAFARLMDTDSNYLDSGIAQNRCAGWKFSEEKSHA